MQNAPTHFNKFQTSKQKKQKKTILQEKLFRTVVYRVPSITLEMHNRFKHFTPHHHPIRPLLVDLIYPLNNRYPHDLHVSYHRM